VADGSGTIASTAERAQPRVEGIQPARTDHHFCPSIRQRAPRVASTGETSGETSGEGDEDAGSIDGRIVQCLLSDGG